MLETQMFLCLLVVISHHVVEIQGQSPQMIPQQPLRTFTNTVKAALLKRSQVNHSSTNTFSSSTMELKGKDENTNNVPWADIVNGSNELYLTIVESIRRTLRFRNYDSCEGRCGILGFYHKSCSCTPSCYYYKTCCYDFFEHCGNLYTEDDINQSDYSWLRNATIECFDDLLMVSSCNVQNPMKRDLTFDSAMLKRFGDDGLSLHKLCTSVGMKGLCPETETNKILYQDNDLNETITITSVINYLHFLSYIVNTKDLNPEKLSPFQSRLLSWPIADGSSGVIYKNKTIYDCNEADHKHMTLINAKWNILPSQYVRGNEAKSLDSILSENPDMTPYYIDSYKQYNLEPCLSGFVSSCLNPDTDHVIRDACETISLPVVWKRSTVNREKFYKNPFCIVCHEELDDSGSLTLFVEENEQTAIGDNHVPIYVRPNSQLFQMFIFTLIVNVPAWNKLACKFVIRQHSLRSSEKDNETIVTDVLTDGEDRNGSRSSRDVILRQPMRANHVCPIMTCHTATQMTFCYFSITLTLLLPPTKTFMTSDRLNNTLSEFKRNLDLIIPERVPMPSTVDSVTRFANRMVLDSTEFKNVFFNLGVRITIPMDSLVNQLNWTAVAVALLESNYLAEGDFFNFCGELELIRIRILHANHNCYRFDMESFQVVEMIGPVKEVPPGMASQTGTTNDLMIIIVLVTVICQLQTL